MTWRAIVEARSRTTAAFGAAAFQRRSYGLGRRWWGNRGRRAMVQMKWNWKSKSGLLGWEFLRVIRLSFYLQACTCGGIALRLPRKLIKLGCLGCPIQRKSQLREQNLSINQTGSKRSWQAEKRTSQPRIPVNVLESACAGGAPNSLPLGTSAFRFAR